MVGWFRDTFDADYARSYVQSALAGSIGDITQDIWDLITPIHADLIDADRDLEKVKILFRHLDAQYGNATLVRAFQQAVSQRGGIDYLLNPRLYGRFSGENGIGERLLGENSIGGRQTADPPFDPEALALALAMVKGEQILSESVILDALHDAGEDEFDQPKCHPETREEMLDSLFEWASTDSESPAPVHWLHGPAGAGKSSILRSTCTRLHNAGRLGGSFFFKRGDHRRDNAQALFVTLAYQLALTDPQMKQSLLRHVAADPTIVTKKLSTQFQELIVEPWTARKLSSPVVLIIDGLDECQQLKAQREILRLIGNAATKFSGPFRFLVASRPEPHIKETFCEDIFTHVVLLRTNVEQSFEDVRTYLTDQFSRILHDHSSMKGHSPPWPSEEKLDRLVDHSSGYFIYAATVVRFVEDENSFPEDQLQLIISLASTEQDPFSSLDQLYRQILFTVPHKHRQKLMDILCLVVDLEVNRSSQIEWLLRLREGEVQLVLRQLHSLINIRVSQLTIHHKSLADFLHDSRRSRDFHLGLGRRARVTTIRAIMAAPPIIMAVAPVLGVMVAQLAVTSSGKPESHNL
ncbi:hypothetical protein C8F01DRAFT_1049244 [Mycena amicta]|nr:hypothetical protein C8F01DRAFT_1049244 [Mycena amicta]